MADLFVVHQIIREFEKQFAEEKWKIHPCSNQGYGASLIENQDLGNFVITGSDSEYPISLKRIISTRSRFSTYKGKKINALVFMGKSFSKKLVSELSAGKIEGVALLEIGEKKKATIYSGYYLSHNFFVREVQRFTDGFIAKHSHDQVNSPARQLENKSKLDRAVEALRYKAKGVREYEIIRKPEERLKPTIVPEAWVYGLEYERAFRFKEKLIHLYNGKSLNEAIPGKITSNEYGECYSVESEYPTQFKKIDNKKSSQVILSELKLVYGIGPVGEQALKQQGYHTIEDLKKHPRWRSSAGEFLEILEAKNIDSLQNWLWRRVPKSDPLVHCLAGLCKDEDFAIFDIETMGLFGRPIILLGIARPGINKICINQFLLRDISDEPGALWEFVSQLDEKSTFITFNGRSFDLPYVQDRFGYYNMDFSLDNPHFDVLHFARRAWRNKLADCRLDTIEKHLGIHRKDDVPSALIPEFYDTYLKTGNVGPLVAIVEHNRHDLTTLAGLFSKLYDEWNL